VAEGIWEQEQGTLALNIVHRSTQKTSGKGLPVGTGDATQTVRFEVGVGDRKMPQKMEMKDLRQDREVIVLRRREPIQTKFGGENPKTDGRGSLMAEGRVVI